MQDDLQTCARLWTYINVNCRPPALKNIEIAERQSLRTITKLRHPNNSLFNSSNQYLYNTTGIRPIVERLLDLSKKFAIRPINMEILQEFITRRDENIRRVRTHPVQDLPQILKDN